MSAMRIFKKRPSARNWTIEIRREDGRPVRFTAFEAKQASYNLGAKFQELFNHARMRDEPPPHLLPWLESLEPDVQQKLVRLKVINSRMLARGRRLDALLSEWEQSRIDHNVGTKDAALSVSRCRAVFAALSVDYLTDIDGEKVVEIIGMMRRRVDSPISMATSNHYIVAVKAFCKWAGRPLPIRKLRVKADQLVTRRYALSDDEQRTLIQTTQASERVYVRWNGPGGMTGPDRALLYRAALRCGLRSNELIGATRSDYDGKTISVVGKNGDRVAQPVPRDLAALLDIRVASLAPAAPLFRTPHVSNMARMLDRDLRSAKIEPPPGMVIDFHALRHSFITALARAGVHVRDAQRLARHKHLRMTLEVYTALNLTDPAANLSALPDLDSNVDSTEKQA